MVAERSPSDRVVNSKTLRDTEIRSIGLQLLLGNSGSMGDGPSGLDGATNTTTPGPDHAPSPLEIESEASIILPSLAGLTEYECRTRLVHLLDNARQQYHAARANRIELMLLARDYGVSCRDIGTVLGISEQSTRDQIKRAQAKQAGDA